MSENYRKLYRSTSERMIAGVCGGLGDYFNLDPTLVRLIFVFGSILTGSALFWAYIIMMIVVPEDLPASQSIVEAPAEEEVEEAEEE